MTFAKVLTSIGVVLRMATNDSMKPKRRWFQYSLRSLLMLMTLVAVACSWYAYEMQQAAKRRAAIAAIEKLGGTVGYRDARQEPNWFSWLRRFHGDERLGNVDIVYLAGSRIDDGGMVNLRCLTNLQKLGLSDTPITDAGLTYLEDITAIEELDLEGTRVTDDGLKHVAHLRDLRQLHLRHTAITDAGLVHLSDLTKLQTLGLYRTQVTNAGLVHLYELARLDRLGLSDTQVSEEGVTSLQEALPNCDVLHDSEGTRPLED